MTQLKRVSTSRTIAKLAFCGLATCVAIGARAQVPEDQYKDLVKVNQQITPLGDNPFGESWNSYTGQVGFGQTDIVLAGTGLPIVIQRKHNEVGGIHLGETYYGFGDWGLEVPRISTLYPVYNVGMPAPPAGWVITSPNNSTPYARCTLFSGPPFQLHDPDGWWMGYQLTTPEYGTQEVLQRAAAYSTVPTGISIAGVAIAKFVAVTATHWQIGCGVNSSNEATGREGFVAVSPSGIRYRLTQMVVRMSSEMATPRDVGPGLPKAYAGMGRRMAHLLVTRIEDRYGNYLTYNYTANAASGLNDLLSTIVASDGRQVSISWDSTTYPEPIITQITAQPSSGQARTWTYHYAGVSAWGTPYLSSVTLPDGSAWQFSLSALDQYPVHIASMNCSATDMTWPAANNASTIYTASMTHPSGLTGTFKLQVVRHGQSYVPYVCNGQGTAYPWVTFSNQFDTMALVSKTFGDHGQNLLWTYSYGSLSRSWAKDCVAPTTCVSSTASTVTAPDGSFRKYTNSNRWDYTEGKLTRMDDYAQGASSPMSSDVLSYASPSAGPYPTAIGYPLTNNGNTAKITGLAPQNLHQVLQSGDTYSWQALSFDIFAGPLHVQRSNTITGQLAADETSAFYNDTVRWILGQPQALTNNATGEVIRQNSYDSSGLLSTRYSFGLKNFDYTWNAQGQLNTFKDGLGRTTTLSSYQYGVPTSIKFADLATQSVGVNAFGEVSSLTDELASLTSYGRDSMGRVSGVTYPAGDTVAWTAKSITYAILTTAELGRPVGTWRSRSVEGRHQVSTYFDSYFRPVLIEDKDTTSAIAIYAVQSYDYAGRLVFKSYPSTLYNETAGVHYTYDALGRQKTRVTTDSITLETDTYLAGNRRQVTDADGRTTTTTYQAFEAPAYDNAILVVAPQSQTTTITRNVYGEIQSVTQSGGGVTATQSNVYDTYHRLCKHIEPETGQHIIQYDAADQISWVADGQALSATVCDQASVATASRVLYTYDLRGRQKTIDYPDTTGDISIGYDNAGHVLTRSNPTATWTYTYNKRGLVESQVATIDGKTLSLNPTYDAVGNTASLVTPDQTIAYSPDAWGRPTKLGTKASSILYHPNGLPKSYTMGNGVQYSLTLDNLLRPYVASTQTATAAIQHFQYGYTNGGDLTSITESVDGADSATMAYDGLHRLLTASGLWGAYGYTYDALNNIRGRTGPNALTYTYNATTNLLTGVSGGVARSYGYNARGEVTSDGVWTYARNMAGQVTQLSAVGTYYYDANGKRIKRVYAGGTEYALYDALGRMVYSELGTTKTDYLALGGHIIAELSGSATTYLHDDHLGSARKATSDTPAVLWNETYDPYGVKLNGVADKVGYTGHPFDVESGLTYAQARFYDPAVGRFLSDDPLSFDPGSMFTFNRYSYVGNDPLDKTDPSGLESSCVIFNNCFGEQSDPETVGRVAAASRAFPAIGALALAAGAWEVGAAASEAVPAFTNSTVRMFWKSWIDSISHLTIQTAQMEAPTIASEATQTTIEIAHQAGELGEAAGELESAAERATAVARGIATAAREGARASQSALSKSGRGIATVMAAKLGYDSVKVNGDGTATGSVSGTGSRIKKTVTCDLNKKCR